MMCIESFPEPYANCCFITDTKLYLSVFHNTTFTHYHCIYETETKTVLGKIFSQEINCSKSNFPYQAFYDLVKNEVYQFYRQGQAYIIDVELTQVEEVTKEADGAEDDQAEGGDP